MAAKVQAQEEEQSEAAPPSILKIHSFCAFIALMQHAFCAKCHPVGLHNILPHVMLTLLKENYQ